LRHEFGLDVLLGIDIKTVPVVHMIFKENVKGKLLQEKNNILKLLCPNTH